MTTFHGLAEGQETKMGRHLLRRGLFWVPLGGGRWTPARDVGQEAVASSWGTRRITRPTP